MPDSSEARHLRIHGRVQGVGYRAALQREAQRLGIRGWVRNRGDGSVEAMAAGNSLALAAFIAWCRTGPPGAAVSGVEIEWAEEPADPTGFRIFLTL